MFAQIERPIRRRGCGWIDFLVVDIYTLTLAHWWWSNTTMFLAYSAKLGRAWIKTPIELANPLQRNGNTQFLHRLHLVGIIRIKNLYQWPKWVWSMFDLCMILAALGSTHHVSQMAMNMALDASWAYKLSLQYPRAISRRHSSPLKNTSKTNSLIQYLIHVREVESVRNNYTYFSRVLNYILNYAHYNMS